MEESKDVNTPHSKEIEGHITIEEESKESSPLE